MKTEETIEAIKNLKSQKYFIILDESLDNRYKVLGPTGEVMTLPDHLFEEEPVCVAADEYDDYFTPLQLQAYEKFSDRIAAQIDRLANLQAETARAQIEDADPNKVRKPSTTTTPRKKKAPKLSSKTGLGASWNSARLTFYRHKIQGLAPKQSFRITVDGVGDFEFIKDDFLRVFNDVVMSPSYLRDGLFSYPDIPEKALRFRK